MAKDPTAIIPFSEGAPGDGLEVEELPSGEVLVGAFDIPDDQPETSFDQNLVEQINERDLKASASELIDYFESDKAGRMEWERRYKDGLKTLDPDGNIHDDDEDRAIRGLSQVVHPLIAEA